MKERKNGLIVVDIIILIIAIVTFILICLCPKPVKTTTYCRDMVVVEGNGADLVLQDINGEVWEVSEEGYQLADTVVVTLDDNGTTYTIYDDKIVNVKPLVVGSY